MKKPVLNYEESGLQEHSVFVFLHGFMGNCRSLQAIISSLAETHHCIAFDLPGHGASLFHLMDSLKTLESIEDVASLILRDLDAMDIRSFSLYGYSMGGRIAQNIALLAPERIERLILESASFGIEDPEERRQRYIRDQALLADVRTEKELEAFLEEWYRLPLFCTLRDTTCLKAVINGKMGNDVTELRRSLDILSVGNHPFYAGRLAGLNFPMFYFYGEKDEAYAGTGKNINKWIPAMKATAFHDASHDIHSQFPELIISALEKITAAGASGSKGEIST